MYHRRSQLRPRPCFEPCSPSVVRGDLGATCRYWVSLGGAITDRSKATLTLLVFLAPEVCAAQTNLRWLKMLLVTIQSRLSQSPLPNFCDQPLEKESNLFPFVFTRILARMPDESRTNNFDNPTVVPLPLSSPLIRPRPPKSPLAFEAQALTVGTKKSRIDRLVAPHPTK